MAHTDVYGQQTITDYPLIGKGKAGTIFKKSLTIFFNRLIHTIAATEQLYDHPELIENVQIWIGTLSSAASRPFRHTATIVALEITSALCEIARDLTTNRANTLRLHESEQKKARVNKARVAELMKTANAIADRRTQLDTIIKEWFSTVFLHRYRDVDPKIRLDCVSYLSDWITTYSELFFDVQYLRYLGWVLSDVASATRLEVVKQLHKLFKDDSKIAGLRQFTERFRARLVEIANQDAEGSVRAAALDLLELLRGKGLLEPNDVDTIGNLIFDTDARVRKAVVAFFVANVDEMYQSKVDDLGGQEVLEEALPEDDEDDFEGPRLSWLRYKCLAELLQSYDTSDDSPDFIEHGYGNGNEVLVAGGTESRFSVAAHSLYDGLSVLHQWEAIAAYLLHDLSSTTNGTSDPATQFQHACRLEEKEETVLLDLLNVSVQNSLAEFVDVPTGSKRVKKNKLQIQEIEEKRETTAQRLAVVIPKLLNKFGGSRVAATAVLRLQRLLNLEIFEQLQQDSTTYSKLLDDINRQFMSHEDETVLAAASAALLHAKSFEDLEEITEGKLQALWDHTANAFIKPCKGNNLGVRGNMSESILGQLFSSVLRIENLSSISDCTEVLDKSRGSSKNSVTVISLLIELVNRGVPGPHMDADINAVEDALAQHCCKAALFYFMWRVQGLRSRDKGSSSYSQEDLESLIDLRSAFITSLSTVLRHRHSADEVSLAVAGTLLDLHTLFTTVHGTNSPPADDLTADLVIHIDAQTQIDLLKVFVAAEKDFAAKSRRKLEEPAEDDDPEDAPTEVSDEDEAGDGDDNDSAQRRAVLVAEERLCSFTSKIVLALFAKVLDGGRQGGTVRKRLVRNKGKLGGNFKEVLAYLEKPAQKKDKTSGGGAKAAKSAAPGQAVEGEAAAAGRTQQGRAAKNVKSKELVEDDDEDEDAVEVEEDGVEDLRARGLADVGNEEAEAGAGEEGTGGADDDEPESVLGD